MTQDHSFSGDAMQGVEHAENLEGERDAPGNAAVPDVAGEDSFAERMRARVQLQRSKHGQPVQEQVSPKALCLMSKTLQRVHRE